MKDQQEAEERREEAPDGDQPLVIDRQREAKTDKFSNMGHSTAILMKS
jgi:hypothetical protein